MTLKIFLITETALLIYFMIRYKRAETLLRGLIEIFGDEIDRMYEESTDKEDKR